jgi:hypothetical protein
MNLTERKRKMDLKCYKQLHYDPKKIKIYKDNKFDLEYFNKLHYNPKEIKILTLHNGMKFITVKEKQDDAYVYLKVNNNQIYRICVPQKLEYDINRLSKDFKQEGINKSIIPQEQMDAYLTAITSQFKPEKNDIFSLSIENIFNKSITDIFFLYLENEMPEIYSIPFIVKGK